MRKPYLICDLDGTLCNVEHRLHFIQHKPPRWKEFFEHLEGDTLNEAVDFVLRQFKDIALVFVSGRPEDYRAQSEAWLQGQGYISFKLYMRSTGDFREDWIIKEELYRQQIEPELGKPQVIFDDRDQVVAMWRRLGLACFQVKKGDY